MYCLLEKTSTKMFGRIIISFFKKNLKSTFQKNLFIQKIFSFFIKIIESEFFINTRLTLTYDNMRLQDGIGAQLQRIISLKAISEQLGCGFCKFKIIDFDETVFLNFTSDQKESMLKKWEQLININSVESRSGLQIRLNPKRLSYLYLIRIFTKLSFIPIKLSIAFPGPLIDRNNSIYEFCKKYSVEREQNTIQSSVIHIVVHLRRGEALLSQFRSRYLPLEYYEDLLEIIVSEIKASRYDYKITIISEDNSNLILSSNDVKVKKSIEIDPVNPYLVEQPNGDYLILNDNIDKDKYPILFSGAVKFSGDAFIDFNEMLRADILLISKSSFSFTAGLLNGKALKIYPLFWHNPPSTWVNSDVFTANYRRYINEFVTQRALKI